MFGTSNLFSNPTQQQQTQQTQTQTPLFGGTLNNSNNNNVNNGIGIGNNSTNNMNFGNQNSQTGLQITSLTRHSDLPESQQKEIDEIDKYISDQENIAETLKTQSESHEQMIKSIPIDANVLIRKLSTSQQALHYGRLKLSQLKDQVNVSVKEAQVCFHILTALLTPGSRMPQTDPLIPYFASQCDKIKEKIKIYEHVLSDIEANVDSIESDSSSASSSNFSSLSMAEELSNTLHEQYSVLMALGSRIAETHQIVSELE